MVWRLLSVGILLFWMVMTGFIIRDAYFPDGPRFTEVSPKFVFDLYLNEAAAFNNTLHLYHDGEKRGFATFAIRRQSGGKGESSYVLFGNGSVSPSSGEKSGEGNNAFAINAELEKAESWKSFEFETGNPVKRTEARIRWKRGNDYPEMEVKRDGEVIMNAEMARALLSVQGGEVGGEWRLLGQWNGVGVDGMLEAMRLRAREGIMELAGKRRRCYIVSAGMSELYEVKIYFTEVGEMARVEFPGGYRLLEPLMHGLDPGMDTMK